MKRFVIFAVLFLLCLALPASVEAREKKQTPDLTNMKHIFLGWVALDPETSYDLGYTRPEWEDVIHHENVKFQKSFQTQCATGFETVAGITTSIPGFRTIMGAKDSKDENTAGNDLYIKFSNVNFSTGYVLTLSAHLIDLKTNTEVATIPAQKYTAHLCGLMGCLESELDQVNRKLEQQLSCPLAVKY
jgi:hypothetical protein